MKVYLATYGCQANERDSETILGILDEMGYAETAEESEADVILLNTCCIRDKAEQKVYSYLGTLKQYKQKNPDLVIGLCGCMAQEPDTPGLIRRRTPHVDFILGTHRLHRLREMILGARAGQGFQSDREETGEISEGLPSVGRYPFKALVNITFGCDNFCSYCVVPYVRGRERSRLPEDVIGESRRRASEGALELTYLGQNVNAYGKHWDTRGARGPFADLLYQAQEIPGVERIRFLTSHPRDFGQDLIDAIAGCPKVARHVHLPVQSGSSRILGLMNRGYNREDYFALVEDIRRRIPDVVLSTDIIVGFPGERDEDFQDTVDLLTRLDFDSAFTFMYSPRRGTAAAAMDGQIPLKEKKARLQAVMDVQAANNIKLHRKLIGKQMKVLAESWEDGVLSGRGEGNQLIHFPGKAEDAGRFHQVTVTEAQTWTLKGERRDGE